MSYYNIYRAICKQRHAACGIGIDIQLIPVEINLRKEKWLLITIYRPPDQTLAYFIEHLSSFLDSCAIKYENVIVMGDFNETASSTEISSFLDSHGMTSLFSTPTCFKSIGGRCIDLVLTNRRDRFFKSSSFETGLSDFHHLIYGVLKTTYEFRPPIKQAYRSFKKFSPKKFRSDLSHRLQLAHSGSFLSFNDTLTETLDEHAPPKTRVLRGNHKPHVNKALRKAIMKRSQLKNRANRSGIKEDYENYKKQRNIVSKMNKQSKKRFFAKLDQNGQKGNKGFWKACKPFFSNKICPLDEKVSLVEKDAIIADDQSVAHIFNDYFVNVGANVFKTGFKPRKKLSIHEMIQRYADHPSIRRIKSHVASSFTFPHIEP